MRKYLLFLLLLVSIHSFAQTKIVSSDSIISIENGKIALDFKTDIGTYRILDKTKNILVLDEILLSADYWTFECDQKKKYCYHVENLNSLPGKKGKAIIITVSSQGKKLPLYKWMISLGDCDNYIEYKIGLSNTLPHDCRLMTANPITNAKLFPNKVISHVQTLNGAAGKTLAEVVENSSRNSTNSMLLTCLVNGERFSVVWGGLKYNDFYAETEFDYDAKTISLIMKDPLGKLITKGETFWTTDTYYLGLVENNPFIALENYGTMLRQVNNACPNVFDYPTLCGWAVGALSHDKNVNNSVDLLEQLRAANDCGLTNYTKVAIRLEPDTYCYTDGNTEQGWWDDEHWSAFGHLKAPYHTFKSWCQAIRKHKGIPYTYIQSGMPSDDFAEAYPEWMLNEDISKLHVFHRHQQPNVRYDYTDKGFRKHVLGVWKYLKEAGLEGVKFDYPETAWIEKGGFDDKFATTTSAYRSLFQLAREGLGPNARLTERNLGAGGCPTLDVTAGVADMQRITQDNNLFVAQHISSSGLRWYKSRSVYNYYPDCKDLLPLNSKERKSLVTMIALTSGMLELATSFKKFTPEMVYDVSRIYPMYNGIKSPRPIDAFTGVKDPMVYDLELRKDWHQVALFNSSSKTKQIQVSLGEQMIYGGMNLDKNKKYHVYDFWNNHYLGMLNSKGKIEAHLEPLESTIYSVREVSSEPQIIHTNRHIFQGWMDLHDVTWKKANKTLEGRASVISGETFKMVVALNEMTKIVNTVVGEGEISVSDFPNNQNLKVISIVSNSSSDIYWKINFM